MKKILLITIVACLSSCENEPNFTPKVGEKYSRCLFHDSMNPFPNGVYDTLEVIDIQGDYIQYKYSNGFISSGRLSYFKEESTLINTP